MTSTADEVLGGLKDFQRETVAHVFEHMYRGHRQARKFLIADEVGLGKTLVARGVTARAVEELDAQGVERIDVVYICSNQDIARQNINRLNFMGEENESLTSRITLMPRDVKGLKERPGNGGPHVNFVSITPGTSLDPKSKLGAAPERAVLTVMLEGLWGFGHPKAVLKMMRGDASLANFQRSVDAMRREGLDSELTEAFGTALQEHDLESPHGGLRQRFEELAREFLYHRTSTRPNDELRQRRADLVSELRSQLATSCIEALEPDLIILDEFQRFRSLLQGEEEAGRLARVLFNYEDTVAGQARVLLLSATPYKMYTKADEAEDEDHYRDFTDTLRFLFEDDRAEEVSQLLKGYRQTLYRGGEAALDDLKSSRDQLQDLLSQVMVRTERLAATADRNGMLSTSVGGARLEPGDVDAYRALCQVSDVIGQSDSIEYWKSGSYLLNFMDSYRFKRDFRETAADPARTQELAEKLAGSPGLLLDREAVEQYESLDPGNARLRSLVDDVIDSGAWRLLWLPPALPYYAMSDAFEQAKSFTKRLVFSSWQVVPKVVAACLSYMAEREMMHSFDEGAQNTSVARAALRPLLAFARSQGRLTGMPVAGLLYPSFALAELGDPRRLGSTNGPPSLENVLASAEARIEERLAALGPSPADGAEDETWYWAAPVLLDRAQDPTAAADWLDNEYLAYNWSGEESQGEESSAWEDHADRVFALSQDELGRRPDDLAKVLAELAVAGPGVCALRALGVASLGGSTTDIEVRDAAGHVAWAMRSLFNSPEVTSLVRESGSSLPYWRQVLAYCAQGCLQAVFDEYAHVLSEALFVKGKEPAERAAAIADGMADALTLRTASLGVDDIKTQGGAVVVEQGTMRARYAARFGDERSADSTQPTRADQVRKAFNSPFWPFVLTTTSVGQEGLDFHSYCHAVVHWNLPSNPVDLEQREGRVHRYKGHAVRKNVAAAYRDRIDPTEPEVWNALFQAALGDRADDDNDLTPYWIFRGKDGQDPVAQIERRVPLVPLSKDSERFDRLRRALVVYRMAFGQPRQEELTEYLLERYSVEEVERLSRELRLDLGPSLAGT